MSGLKESGGISPKLWGALLGLGGLMLFFGFVALDDPARGELSAFSFFAIAMSIRMTWKDHSHGWYVPLYVGIAVAHILAIWLIPWQWRSVPALTFFPVVIAEIWLIVFATRVFSDRRS